jgi:hypothetical protein
VTVPWIAVARVTVVAAVSVAVTVVAVSLVDLGRGTALGLAVSAGESR